MDGEHKHDSEEEKKNEDGSEAEPAPDADEAGVKTDEEKRADEAEAGKE